MSFYITCDHCGTIIDTNDFYELQIHNSKKTKNQTSTYYLCATCLGELQNTFFNHKHTEIKQEKTNTSSKRFDQSVPENFIHQTLRTFLNAPAYLNQDFDVVFQDEYKKPPIDYLQWLDKEILNVNTDYKTNKITITLSI